MSSGIAKSTTKRPGYSWTRTLSSQISNPKPYPLSPSLSLSLSLLKGTSSVELCRHSATEPFPLYQLSPVWSAQNAYLPVVPGIVELAFKHPGVGPPTDLRKHQTLAVWRGNCPDYRHVRIFQHNPSLPFKIDAQRCLLSGTGIGPVPQAFAVCCKV